MNEVQELKYETLNDRVPKPEFATEGAAAFDLTAQTPIAFYKGSDLIDKPGLLKHSLERNYLNLRNFERVIIGTGIKVEIPKGFHLQIVSRSGMTAKQGLIILNSPGIIDSDYRGEIKLIVYNTTPFLNKIVLGSRVAQAILMPNPQINLVAGEVLNNTERGEGGLGSTGTK